MSNATRMAGRPKAPLTLTEGERRELERYVRARTVSQALARRARMIREFVDAHNADPKPFIWTKSADAILASVARFCTKTLNEQGIA
jgi:hypothetical protein